MPPYSYSGPEIQERENRVILSHFLRQIESAHVKTPHTHPRPLHYDSKTQLLCSWLWPCNPITEERYPPDELELQRRTHYFLGPSCLCAFLDGTDYTEARIGVVETLTEDPERNKPILNGEYVAVCAERRCGYFLCLERFYPVRSLELQVCKKRWRWPISSHDRCHCSGGNVEVQFLLALEVRNPVAPRLQRVMALKQLTLGVKEEAFWAIFVQCQICKQLLLHGDVITLTKHLVRIVIGGSQRLFLLLPRFSAFIADTPESPPSELPPSDDDVPTSIDFLNALFSVPQGASPAASSSTSTY
ncbi:hypothetical protein DFP72DRAFT_857813 [Ephemerocybe angulata]|uniref:Uncharacterized protein n=1 Tax=Ephemerocybe angulata TaxID=980116 RepID=A0A8H6LWY1_9AGAR|nr:hypothetical protein DFP72DRAFT_857813 [Tulosesus angulatus]